MADTTKKLLKDTAALLLKVQHSVEDLLAAHSDENDAAIDAAVADLGSLDGSIEACHHAIQKALGEEPDAPDAA
jgi:hypothetical protein